MKKTLSVILTALLAVTMTVPMFAAYKENATSDIAIEVQKANTAQAFDGKISDGEYYEINVDPSWLSYAVNSDDLYDRAENLDYKLYLSYDDTNMRIAAVVNNVDDFYFCDGADPTAIWNYTAMQLGLADADAMGNEFLETGYARADASGDLISTVWLESPYKAEAFTPVAGETFTVGYEGGTLTYEIAVPFKGFADDNRSTGDQVLVGLVLATGDGTGYCHTQFGYGVTGDPGKQALGFMVATLADAPAVVEPEPEVVAPAEDTAAPAEVAPTDTAPAETTAPATADASLILLAVAAVSACGIGFGKKRK